MVSSGALVMQTVCKNQKICMLSVTRCARWQRPLINCVRLAVYSTKHKADGSEDRPVQYATHDGCWRRHRVQFGKIDAYRQGTSKTAAALIHWGRKKSPVDLEVLISVPLRVGGRVNWAKDSYSRLATVWQSVSSILSQTQRPLMDLHQLYGFNSCLIGWCHVLDLRRTTSSTGVEKCRSTA